MKFLVLGLNHKTANIEVRERLAFNGQKLEEGIFNLKKIPGIKEVALLSTCNRVEIYAYVNSDEKVAESIKNFLSRFHNIQKKDFENDLYIHTDYDAIRHILRVSSSLDSMIVGEPQILGQIKDAFDFALSKKTTHIFLNKLLKKALSVAKKVRTETKIAENAVSISFAAVELAKKIFTDLEDISFMLIGAGEMAELAARHLISNGARSVKVTNRTYERGCELANEFNGRPVKFEDFLQELVHTDIVICSTDASTYMLHKDQMRGVMKDRKHKPVFIIDISVPRNIDPEINKIDNVYLYDIDDIQNVVDTNILERKKEAEKAEKIVTEEVEKFITWMSSLNSMSTIVALRQKGEDIKEDEIVKFKNKFPDIDSELMRAIQRMAASIVNKLMHPPTVALKEDEECKDELIAMINKLYGINGDENDK